MMTTDLFISPGANRVRAWSAVELQEPPAERSTAATSVGGISKMTPKARGEKLRYRRRVIEQRRVTEQRLSPVRLTVSMKIPGRQSRSRNAT
jgi:hypothetical protein